MRNALFALFCLVAAAAAAPGTEMPADFRFTIPLAALNGGGLHRVEIPLAVHTGAMRTDLGDLRVFNARGEKVPFAFAGDSRREIERRAPVALPLFPIYRDGEQPRGGARDIDVQVRLKSDGTIVSMLSHESRKSLKKVDAYLVDASRVKEQLRALQLDWVARPGRIIKLNVEGSDNLRSWHTLVSGAPLLDLEFAGEHLTQKRVEFVPARVKYLRLTWDRDNFDLKSLQAEIPESAVQAPAQTLKAEGAPGEKPGEYLFDFGARPPIERLQLLLPQANTVVPVMIYSRADAKATWRIAAVATFYRLTRDGAEVVSPPVYVAARAEREWLVRVEQKGGGIGAGVLRLEGAWTPRQIIFVARGEGPYSLAYGRAETEPGNFAIASVIPGYKAYSEFALPLAHAGPAAANAGPPPSSFPAWMHDTDWKRVTLWTILIGGVAFLGWMAWRLSQQMRKSAADEDVREHRDAELDQD